MTHSPDNRGPTGWRLRALLGAGKAPGIRVVLMVWLGLIVLSVVMGLLNVVYGWNGLAFTIAGLPLSVTVYPPFVVAVLLALWVGPAWGIVPLYLANLTSALASGMAASMAGLFAFAGPVEIAVLWGSMALLNVSPSLPNWRDRGLFVLIGLIAPTASSLATPIWKLIYPHCPSWYVVPATIPASKPALKLTFVLGIKI